MISEFISLIVHPAHSLQVPALERIELYKSRTCCFVTTRILVVDLLSSRVLPRQIAGGWGDQLVTSCQHLSPTKQRAPASSVHQPPSCIHQ